MNNSKLIKQLAVVASGSVGAHIITIAFTPFIARLFGPEAIGVLGTFTALLAIASPLAALTYPMGIVLPKEDGEASDIVTLSIILTICTSSIGVIALWIIGNEALNKVVPENLPQIIYLLPLAMLALSLKQIIEYWQIRKLNFLLLAKISIYHALFLNISKVVAGWFYASGFLLVVVTILGLIFHVAFLIFQTLPKNINLDLKDIKLISSSVVRVGSKYSDFAMFRAPQISISAISQSVPVILIASFFGSAQAGLYSMATMLLLIPSALIGRAVIDVFYPHLNKVSQNGGDFLKHIFNAAKILFLIGVFPFGIIILYGPQIFSFILGVDWAVAGEYGKWLALFYFCNFLNQPFVAVVPVIGIQSGLLLYELISTASKIIGFLIGYYYFSSDIVAVGLFSIIGVIAYICMMFWISVSVKRWSMKC